jgi:hypothetical protein
VLVFLCCDKIPEKSDYLMATRKNRDRDRDQDQRQDIPFKGMPPVTYFPQFLPPSNNPFSYEFINGLEPS